MLAEPARWQTHLGKWVADISVEGVTAVTAAGGVPVTRNAVYDWIAGRRSPRPEVALLLVDFSRGAITLEDIYRHPTQLRAQDAPIVKGRRQ